MDKKYYIGADIGTESVGWAVTDEDYNILKARGRELWGSYLFDKAESAAERRLYRNARRRTARVRRRLNLLQELFAEEISKVDPLFFIRLNNSSLFTEDKDGVLTSKDALFADEKFCDKDYFKKYPTIYHLRSGLIKGEVDDIRLFYLAVHHIIKYRGHFLFELQNFSLGNSEIIREKFYLINAFLSDRDMPVLDLSDLDKAIDELKKKEGSKRSRQKLLTDILHTGSEKSLTAVVKAITGGSVKLKELYNIEEDNEKITSFSFEKSTFEDNDMPAIEEAVGIDEAVLVRELKAIYDWSVLCEIMGEETYVSFAKVKIYEKHREDLAWLKRYIRENCPEKYTAVFRNKNGKDNYAAYVGMDKQKRVSKCTREEFYAFLRKEVEITDKKVLAEIERSNFMPKQVSEKNGVIPYQVHLTELRRILDEAEKKFPFLKEKKDGKTVAEKIIMLMTFRIPYYVGPLHTQSDFGWSVRNPGYEKVSITPWNYSEAIDEDASEEKFIRLLTKKCTYLKGEDVLPENSLLYSEFAFLNELNNLRINGEKSEEARRLIYEYAKTHKKVTLKSCLALLIRNGCIPAGSGKEIFSGIDDDFKRSLKSYNDLSFLGEKRYTHSEMCEKIITWLTLISDKHRFEKRLRREYGKILTEEEIKKLKSLNYSKWGRLSEKLLDGITSARCTDENSECLTIIEAMRKKGENFMQLMSDKYGFQDAIREYNSESEQDEKVTYKKVSALYCSPAVKRSIWKTIEIVKEIVKIQGKDPAKVFIEMAREVKDGSMKGSRTVSRKDQLLELYKNIKGEEREWIAEIEQTPDAKFNSDKLVLYYRQLGKSMYSGKDISIDEVFDTNICDIDHIYPQSKIKDDSLDNRVLVYKTENQGKQDKYPIAEDIRVKMTPFWKMLKERKLISDVKFERLIRRTQLTQDELKDFINRQLVFTRQSTKAVAQLLKEMLPDTEIVYAKAGNANDFKSENNIIKIRELNDLHHAKDAYINIVVGNVYNTKFNHSARFYFNERESNDYDLKNLYRRDIPGAWKVADKERIIQIVEKNTAKAIRMTLGGQGRLFDVNPVKAGQNDDLLPLKMKGAISDTSKYGGYNSQKTAYFMLVRSKGKKGKIMLSMEAFPLWMEKQNKAGIEEKVRFCAKQGLVEPEIVIDRIKLNTLLYMDGSYAWLRGKTGNRIKLCNANQLYLNKEEMKILKRISNYMTDRKLLKRQDLPVGEKIKAEDNVRLYDALAEKLESPVYRGLSIRKQAEFLKKSRERFISLSLEKQCVVIFEVLHLMQCNSVNSDLTLLGGVPNAGSLVSSKFVQDNEMKIIYQSCTGYYREIIDFKRFL